MQIYEIMKEVLGKRQNNNEMSIIDTFNSLDFEQKELCEVSTCIFDHFSNKLVKFSSFDQSVGKRGKVCT